MFIYLFSRGHDEYKLILGRWSVWIYHVMYKIVTSNSNVIVNHERLFDKKKSHLISVSRLDESWFENHKNVLLDKIRFLYVGRMSQEKGIFYFLKMFTQIKIDAELQIVSNLKDKNFANKICLKEKFVLNKLKVLCSQKLLIVV